MGDLNSIITKGAKKYGGNVFLKASDAPCDFPRLPAGIYAFDFCTCGGIPAGASTCIWGAFSSGKSYIAQKIVAQAANICFNCFSYVWDCKCKEPVTKKAIWLDAEGCVSEEAEIFDPVSGFVGQLKEYVKQETHNIVSYRQDGTLSVESPFKMIDSGIQDTILLKTKTTELRVTLEHPVLVYKKGTPEWVHAKDIEIGDYVARPWKCAFAGKASGFSKEDAELIGMLLGDGTLSDVAHSCTFTKTDNKMCERVGTLIKDKGYIVNKYDDRHCRLIRRHKKGAFYSKGTYSLLKQWLVDIGMVPQKSSERKIPPSLLMETTDVISALLTGLWMTDGTVNGVRPSAAYSSSSRTLIVQIRWLLSRLGILGRVHKYTYKNPKHSTTYTITINGLDNMRKLNSYLSLYSNRKENIEKWCNSTGKCNKYAFEYLLPNYDNHYHYKQREDFLNQSDVWWDKIVSKQGAGKVQCYDASVFKYNSWTVNDVIVHNSLDWAWAKSLGVPEDLTVVSGLVGEEYVDIFHSAIRADDVGLIVVDSLASMVPAAEMEGSAIDRYVMTTARMATYMVRKGKTLLLKERRRGHHVAVLIINQVRTKMTLPGQSPEEIPGGNASKHDYTLMVRTGRRAVKPKDSGGMPMFTTTSIGLGGAMGKKKLLVLAGTGQFDVASSFEHEFKRGTVLDDKVIFKYVMDNELLIKNTKGYTLSIPGMEIIQIDKQQDLLELWRADPHKYLSTQKSIIDIEKAKRV